MDQQPLVGQWSVICHWLKHIIMIYITDLLHNSIDCATNRKCETIQRQHSLKSIIQHCYSCIYCIVFNANYALYFITLCIFLLWLFCGHYLVCDHSSRMLFMPKLQCVYFMFLSWFRPFFVHCEIYSFDELYYTNWWQCLLWFLGNYLVFRSLRLIIAFLYLGRGLYQIWQTRYI